MKITSWKLELTWEDGTVNDVSNYVPSHTSGAIESFIDYWEEKYSDDEEEVHPSFDPVFKNET
jgi:hypothetical protein